MQETATRMPPHSETEVSPASERERHELTGRLYITQSPFYSPAFNGAIFDGPLRLYFAQTQEALALKFYFEFRSKMQEMAKFWPRTGGPNLFVMVYPTDETFDLCFLSQGLSWNEESLPQGRLGRDHVIGLQASNMEAELTSILEKTLRIVRGLTPALVG